MNIEGEWILGISGRLDQYKSSNMMEWRNKKQTAGIPTVCCDRK